MTIYRNGETQDGSFNPVISVVWRSLSKRGRNTTPLLACYHNSQSTQAESSSVATLGQTDQGVILTSREKNTRGWRGNDCL